MSQSPPIGAARERELVSAFVNMADTLVDDYDVVELLHVLARRCVDLLGAAAAGILLADQRGGIQVVATSDERARLLELFQLQADEGPCLDAYHTGEIVQVDDLTEAGERWPAFVPEALAEGYHSVQAVPMRLRGTTIGALNLFGAGTGPLAQHDLAIARALADTATIGILHERALRRSEVLTEQLQTALNNRIVIEQAKGLLFHAAHISTGQAFEHLRAYSRDSNVRLSDVAQQLLSGSLQPVTVLAHNPTGRA